jgi:hypothetical protein
LRSASGVLGWNFGSTQAVTAPFAIFSFTASDQASTSTWSGS